MVFSQTMRHILHADFDAFFASVEQLDNPIHAGKPVVVGGRPENRGVVASASYEARNFGIRSAMAMKTAQRLCHSLVRVDPRFDRYREVSLLVMGIFKSLTPLVEPVSLDEAYLDISHLVKDSLTPKAIALSLKTHIEKQTGLTISIGVATSKSVAKIASDMDKPDGLTVVLPGEETIFLSPLKVRQLWGVGPKTAEKLSRENILTIGDIAQQADDWMQSQFGINGSRILKLSRGEDTSPVRSQRKSKSISAETTFAHDTDDLEALQDAMNRLSIRVIERLTIKKSHGYTIKLKIRLADFTTFTRQKTVQRPISSSQELFQAGMSLLQSELQPSRKLRLLGLGVSNFTNESKPPIGDQQLRLLGF